MQFKVGDKVRWSSQAGGNTREKNGEVIAVVPSNMDPVPIMAQARDMWDATAGRNTARIRLEKVYMMRADLQSWGRHGESFLVEVRDSPTRKLKLYWPLVGKLEAVRDEEQR